MSIKTHRGLEPFWLKLSSGKMIILVLKDGRTKKVTKNIKKVWNLFSDSLKKTVYNRFRCSTDVWLCGLIYLMPDLNIIRKQETNEHWYQRFSKNRSEPNKKKLQSFKKGYISQICLNNIRKINQMLPIVRGNEKKNKRTK